MRYKVIIVIVIFIVLVIIALSIYFIIDANKNIKIDNNNTVSAQRVFLKDKFLNLEPGELKAIQLYGKILKILSTKNISRKNIDVNKDSISNIEEFKKISSLLIMGARQKTLGEFKYKDTVSIEVQDCNDLDIANIIIIPKLIRNSIENEPDIYQDLNRNILLAKSCIALGIQCLEYKDNSMFCLVGIVCKREGIEILELYRHKSEDREFSNIVDDIYNEYIKERDYIKKITRGRIKRHVDLEE